MIGQMILAGIGPMLQAPPPGSGDKLGEQIGQELAKSINQAQIPQQVADAMKQIPWHQITIIGALTGVLVPLGFFALIGLIIWMLLRKSQSRTVSRSEFYKQVLDKFSSGREFTEFLESKGGQQFLADSSSQPLGVKERILKTTRIGTFLTVFGLGLLALSLVKHNLVVAGGILIALGVGFLVSARISYDLSKKLDLLPAQRSESVNEPVSNT